MGRHAGILQGSSALSGGNAAANVVIRPVGADERAGWEPLWNGYLTFYEATLALGATDTTWSRLHDPNEPMFLLKGGGK